MESMRLERSYVSGAYDVPEMDFYGGWVAHAGSFASHQTFFGKEREIALLLAGECFPGDRFRNGTDQPAIGSWLIDMYEEDGDRFFGNVNGLFSGLLVDKRRRKAFLFNDRYGMERIYYHESADAFYFASEAKALLRILPQARAFDPVGVAQFLAYGCTVEERTLFRDIQLLPGGALWSFAAGKYEKGKYFRPETWEALPKLPADLCESRFQEIFRRIVPHYFEPASQTGISLTGGLDTRMIMACSEGLPPGVACYTFAGINGTTYDALRAAQVAAACGLNHRVLRIGNEFLSHFGKFVDETVYATDGSCGVTGAHEIYLNRLAHAIAPIRLTGNFGSEVLRGVSTFKPLRLDPVLMGDGIQSTIDKEIETASARKYHPVRQAAFLEIPRRLFGTLAAARSQIVFRTPYLDNEIVELAFQAPFAKPRSPLPALRFVNRYRPELAQIPTDRGEVGIGRGIGWVLRRIFSEVTFKLDYLDKEGLPHALTPFEPVLSGLSRLGILGRHKFLPFRSWFRRELAPFVKERLNDPRVRRNPLWNQDFVGELPNHHMAGQKNYVSEINTVLTLEAVDRLLLNGA